MYHYNKGRTRTTNTISPKDVSFRIRSDQPGPPGPGIGSLENLK